MSAELTKIVWREWFNAAAVAQLIAMDSLPRNETTFDCRLLNGDEVAAAVARLQNKQDGEAFRDGGMLTISEPAEFAGDYRIVVDYEPTFFAYSE